MSVLTDEQVESLRAALEPRTGQQTNGPDPVSRWVRDNVPRRPGPLYYRMASLIVDLSDALEHDRETLSPIEDALGAAGGDLVDEVLGLRAEVTRLTKECQAKNGDCMRYADERATAMAEVELHKKRWADLREHIQETGEFELSAGHKLSGYLCRDLVTEMDALARGDGAE